MSKDTFTIQIPPEQIEREINTVHVRPDRFYGESNSFYGTKPVSLRYTLQPKVSRNKELCDEIEKQNENVKQNEEMKETLKDKEQELQMLIETLMQAKEKHEIELTAREEAEEELDTIKERCEIKQSELQLIEKKCEALSNETQAFWKTKHEKDILQSEMYHNTVDIQLILARFVTANALLCAENISSNALLSQLNAQLRVLENPIECNVQDTSSLFKAVKAINDLKIKPEILLTIALNKFKKNIVSNLEAEEKEFYVTQEKRQYQVYGLSTEKTKNNIDEIRTLCENHPEEFIKISRQFLENVIGCNIGAGKNCFKELVNYGCGLSLRNCGDKKYVTAFGRVDTKIAAIKSVIIIIQKKKNKNKTKPKSKNRKGGKYNNKYRNKHFR